MPNIDWSVEFLIKWSKEHTWIDAIVSNNVSLRKWFRKEAA